MTALGKTLTVFVFLLSLVWCWLTVNAFTTRTNWKTQAEAAKIQVDAAVTRAREIEAAYNELKAANAAETKKLNDTIANNAKTIDDLNRTNGELKANYDRKLAAEKEAENKTALLEKNLKTISDQLDLSKNRGDALEGKLTAAVRSEQDAKNAALQQKLEADSLKVRNEQVELTLAQLQERIRDMQRGGNGIGQGSVVPVRPDLKASVTRVDGDLITISLGADAGLAQGAVLDIGRLNPAPGKYLGKIRILQASPKDAVGRFESASGGKVTGENVPKIGDYVGVFN